MLLFVLNIMHFTVSEPSLNSTDPANKNSVPHWLHFAPSWSAGWQVILGLMIFIVLAFISSVIFWFCIKRACTPWKVIKCC